MIQYAKGPVSYLYQDKTNRNGVTSRSKAKQILWGDWVRVSGPDAKAGWMKVKYGSQNYFMKKDDLQDERVLEIIFLDVGQGDGCILTEPGSHDDPRIMVIDAGKGGNMNGFLGWRFQDFPATGNIHAAVITHPDSDHYGGFKKIFKNTNYSISQIYHNGIVERDGDERLGPMQDGYLTDILRTNAEVEALVNDPANLGRREFPNLLKSAVDAAHIGPIKALTTETATKQDGKSWVPGFAPDDHGPISIELLGPVEEPDPHGNARLRAFGTSPTSIAMHPGKTKNGHSILLRLEFNGFRVLFGGDLNKSSETFLMLWYGNDETVPPPLAGRDPLLAKAKKKSVIKAAKERLECDFMKTCHHGSSDGLPEFLDSVFATAFMISSGDNEGHVHPRPDLMGLLGKRGRGERPLLLSTELLRSTREREDPALKTKLEKLSDKIEKEIAKGENSQPDKIKKWKAERKDIRKILLRRNVGVYGSVNLRTDGKDAIIAFRKESSSDTNRWFYYKLKRNEDGDFVTALKGH